MSSCAIELVVAQLSVVEIVLRHMCRIPATDHREIRDRDQALSYLRDARWELRHLLDHEP